MPAGQWIKRIAAHYAIVHACGKEPAAITAIDLSDWARAIEKIAEGLHDGSLSTTDLSERFIRDTHSELAGGAREGYGKEWSKPDPETGAVPDDVRSMQQNIWRFSVSKDFAVQVALSEALVRNGKVTPYADFKAYALQLNKEYNEAHLRTEYLTARQGANMAAQWETYVRGKDQFPNLKYRTQEDDRVREEHAALSGKVAAVDDPFWDKYYPPNGWRCRCYVVQTAETASENLPTEIPTVPAQFRANVGKGNQLFNEGTAKDSDAHPYFSLAKEKGGKEYEREFEKSKRYAPAVEVHRASNGATVSQSIWADSTDAQRNVEVGKVIADSLGLSVKITGHTDGMKLVREKNPEYEIDGKAADRKSITSDGVKNALRKSEKQGAELMVLDLDNSPLSIEEAQALLEKSFRRETNYPAIQEVIITKGKKAYHLKRSK